MEMAWLSVGLGAVLFAPNRRFIVVVFRKRVLWCCEVVWVSQCVGSDSV